MNAFTLGFWLGLLSLFTAAIATAQNWNRVPQAVPVSWNQPAPRYAYPQPVRQLSDPERLIIECYRLSNQKLRYQFGSSNPRSGGLDCSGATQHLLTQVGLTSVPRTANDQYNWLSRQRLTQRMPSFRQDDFLRRLEPGHLLFWSGTYKTSKPITHVMVYLGTDRRTGKPIVFGARSSSAKGLGGHGVDFFEMKTRLGKNSKLVAVAKVPGFQYGR